ncbi:MAG: phosphoglucosamine mutase [Xanthomonadaceae bacterium]|nr:phosphoglucosamine mutase [Xanthomonadaceae bacterium]
MTEKKFFGTDGIRGRVGTSPISADFMLKLGWAAGRVLRRNGQHARFIIGKDTRISGYLFESALEAGLVSAGADVLMLGPMPTPAVAYLTRSMDADAGIVISASHNPHYDNGIKFFSADGEKLDDATELAIEAMLDEPFDTVESERLGRASRVTDAVERYIGFCRATVPDALRLDGLRIALDCAHGATYQVAPRLLTDLGAELSLIGAAPDGLNINLGVGSTHIEALQGEVVATGADFGIAFDGDGDRLQMVDGDGAVLDGDDLLYILACDWHSSGRLQGPVVGTLMTNYGLEQAFTERGIGFIRAKVGDRYVMELLRQHRATLGGETSGHVLCLDRASTGDGLVSALQVLEIVRRRGQDLRALRQGWRKLPQRTINVRIARGTRPDRAPDVVAELADAQARLQGAGRVFLRPSGTEPVVRVTAEAEDSQLMDQVIDRLAQVVAAASAQETT